MTNDELLSRTISSLRFPLIVGVVFIHYYIFKDNEITISGTSYPVTVSATGKWLAAMFSNVIPRISVPLFFFISGFLFFYKTEKLDVKTYKRKLRSRAKTLLLPYLVWNTIFLAYTLLKWITHWEVFAPIFKGMQRTDLEFSVTPLSILCSYLYTSLAPIATTVNNHAPDIMGYPVDIPLWFVRDLMLVVVLSPVIYAAIRRYGKTAVIVIGILWYALQFNKIPYLSRQLFVAVFFFTWGAYFSIMKTNFVETFRKYRYVPFAYPIIAIADASTKSWEYNVAIHNIGIIAGIVSAVIITSVSLEKGWIKTNRFLAGSSFFIFALHTLTMSPVAKIICKVMKPVGETEQLVLYFSVPILNIILCLLTYRILEKFTPKIAKALTGGR